MKLVFPLNKQELVRARYLALCENKRYSIKPDPCYQGLRVFMEQNKKSGYKFKLIKVLHVAGEKMLGEPGRQKTLNNCLFASGGLYLALDIRHPDLALRSYFDDFSSGFSHQFGVALSIMSMSKAFGIPWGKLTPIPKSPGDKKKVLDYVADIPGSTDKLQIEAKGVTSDKSCSNARSSIVKKKKDQQSLQNNQSIAMVGIIVQAVQGRQKSGLIGSSIGKGRIEILDPEPHAASSTFEPHNQKAGLYWHYAGAARFAGLYHVADEFIDRAHNLISIQTTLPGLTQFNFDKEALLEVNEQKIIGVQWKLGESPDPQDGIWLYQGIDINVILQILGSDTFPQTEPYVFSDDHDDNINQEHVESILPDGSYFGIGPHPLPGLHIVDQRETDIRNLRF